MIKTDLVEEASMYILVFHILVADVPAMLPAGPDTRCVAEPPPTSEEDPSVSAMTPFVLCGSSTSICIVSDGDFYSKLF